MEEQFVGGWSETMKACADIQAKCNELRSHIEQAIDKKLEVFEAIQYRGQPVSGLNYIVKIHVGQTYVLHVKIFEQLPDKGGRVSLTGVKQKGVDDPIVPF